MYRPTYASPMYLSTSIGSNSRARTCRPILLELSTPLKQAHLGQLIQMIVYLYIRMQTVI